jgi:hypothetical protein
MSAKQKIIHAFQIIVAILMDLMNAFVPRGNPELEQWKEGATNKMYFPRLQLVRN